jgi:hypothetical protein
LATVRKFLATIRISVLHRYYILTEVAVDNWALPRALLLRKA